MVLAQQFFFIRKQGFCNVQILHIVNLVPLLIRYGKGFEVGTVKGCQHTQHLFVIFVIAHGLAVCLQERHILVAGELTTELVYVARLVVMRCLGILECLLGDEAHNVVVIGQAYHGAVHPGLILGHQRKIGIRMADDEVEHGTVKNKIRLQQKSVILLHLCLGKSQRIDIVGLVINGVVDVFYLQTVIIAVTDMADQILALVTHHNYHSVQLQRRQLGKHTVNQTDAVHRYHTLGVVLGQFTKALAHSCCQYYRLHFCLFFSFLRLYFFNPYGKYRGYTPFLLHHPKRHRSGWQ